VSYPQWAEPSAKALEQSRQNIDQIAGEISDDAWGKDSGYSGWSIKDHLSHLAGSHEGVQEVLQNVLDGNDPDFSRFLNLDAINEETRQKFLSAPVPELRANFKEASGRTLELIGKLDDSHGEVKFGPMTMAQALQGFSMHDLEHLEQLKKGLPA
jgi:uncharacterized damage-inducible protein DinB